MTITVTLEENDYLTYQLYLASKSDRIKKNRQKAILYPCAAFILIGGIYATKIDYIGACIFILIAVLWYFLYPLRQGNFYVDHYKDFIKENYKKSINTTAILELDNEYIFCKDEGSEARVKTSQIDKIIEIPDLILITLRSPQSLIIPKQRLENVILVRQTLKAIADHCNIPFINEDDWKWK